ncbi:MAG TPA: hypothetical protein PLI95_23180, partial [Polyangiaceae bacterium]|nr:hypothetical protein [Polyangiaceae bacterium]
MRIAILSPQSAHPHAPLAAALAEQLRARDHEITVVESGSDLAADLRLAALAERPDDFDLVHVMAGPRALTRVGTMHAALVATLSNDSDALPVWRHYAGRVAFLAASQAE